MIGEENAALTTTIFSDHGNSAAVKAIVSGGVGCA
jgi:hypothetical protein